MKRTKLRKWIYALLKLFPLLLMVVFGVYSHRHTIDTYSTEVSQNEVIDFNQLQQQPNSVSDFYVNDSVLTYDDENSYFVATLSGGNIVTYPIRLTNLNPNHKYFGSVNIKASNTNVQLYEFYNAYPVTNINVFDRVSFTFQNKTELAFTIRDVGNSFDPIYFNSFMCIDLTQMFGSGNEPTIQQFNTWYPDDYYDYTLSDKQLLKDVSTLTYNETDIISQSIYCAYNMFDNYASFNTLSPFNSLYDWSILNFFEGNAPLMYTIVFNMLVYQIFIDLMILIYSALTFVIDFTFRCLDGFYDKSSS